MKDYIEEMFAEERAELLKKSKTLNTRISNATKSEKIKELKIARDQVTDRFNKSTKACNEYLTHREQFKQLKLALSYNAASWVLHKIIEEK